MRRTTVWQEVRQMRVEELYARRQRRELTMAEAAELVGVTARTGRRWNGRYETDGAAGVQDRRIGRASARAGPLDEALRMVTRYETRYTGWTVKHCHEHWQAEHGGTRSDTWTKKTLQAAGQIARAPRRGAHRKKRPRKPLPGLRLHQDGATHEWVPGCQWDLMVTLDDAPREIYSAFFVEAEGTMRSVRGLREGIETQGLFCALDPDRGAHSWYTEEAGSTVDQTRLTQGHRALQHLGITLIPAYSPEARGRSERVFRTVQDRLPKELALAGSTAMAAANRSLAERLLPAYTRRVAGPTPDAGTAFVPWIGPNLADILCGQETRVVANDNTVRYQGASLQIPQDRHRFHYVKVTVRVHAYPDGTVAVFHGPRCLARYQPAGRVDRARTRPRRPQRPGPPLGQPPDRRSSAHWARTKSSAPLTNLGGGTTGQMMGYIYRTS